MELAKPVIGTTAPLHLLNLIVSSPVNKDPRNIAKIKVPMEEFMLKPDLKIIDKLGIVQKPPPTRKLRWHFSNRSV